MIKCPKCKAEHEDGFKFRANIEVWGYFQLDNCKEPSADWDISEYGDRNDIEIYCSECGETLFTNEKDAVEYLKKYEVKEDD